METATIEKTPQGDGSASEGLSELESKFPINLPEGLTAEKVKQFSYEKRGIWKKWADKIQPQLEIFQKMFLSQQTLPSKSKSTSVLSIAAGIIETLTARLCKAIWGRDKLVDVLPLDANVAKEQAQIVEDFINQELIFVSRGTQKGKSLIKSALINGVGMWREKWKVTRELRSQPQYAPSAPGGPLVYVGEGAPVETSHQCWDWEESDPLGISFEPSTQDTVAKSPWRSIRKFMSLADFKEWEATGEITKVDEIATITPSGASTPTDWETKRKNWLGGVSNFAYAHHKEYKVDEFCGTIVWEVDQEGEDEQGQPLPKKVMSENFKWIYVEEQVLIHFDLNDLQPKRLSVGSFPIVINPREVFGKSSLHDVVSVQQQVNMFAGKQADLVELAANRPTYYDKRSGLSGKTAYQRTQGLIAVSDVNGIKEGTVDTSAIGVTQTFLEFLINFSRTLTAATEQAQGMQGADTATEFSGLMQLIGTRFEDLADNIVQFMAVPMAQGCLDYYQQFGIDGQMTVRESSVDGQSKPVTRQMLQGRWQIIPNGMNSQADKAAKTKAAIDMMDMFIKLAEEAFKNPVLTGGQLPNLKALADNVLTLMDQRQASNFWVAMPPPTPPTMPPPAGMNGGGAPVQGNGMPPPPMEAMLGA